MSEVAATASVEQACVTSGVAKRSRRAGTRPGGVLAVGSMETKRLATAILEVLAGLRTPREAAETLKMAVSRYYLLEQRALAGLLAACEPRSKGPQRSVERELAQVQRELAWSRRECARQQALWRAAQRAVGLVPAQAAKPAAKNGVTRSRRRRPSARALRAARAIAVNWSGTDEANGVQPLSSAGSDGGGGAVPPRPS